MACFLVGTAEAAVVTGVRSAVKKSEMEKGIVDAEGTQLTSIAENGFAMTTKLGWLQTMLWGGAGLLAVEHVWHGEVVPYAPFLTAMGNPADTAEMLTEMATAGVGMAVLVTLAWYVATLAADLLAKTRGFELPQSRLHVGVLGLVFAGAALMWSVDAAASFAAGEAFSALDSVPLVAAVIGAGFVIWAAYLLVVSQKQAARA